MNKTRLIDYEYIDCFPFGDGEYYTAYKLTIQKSYLWGLWKVQKKVGYKVSMFSSIKGHEKYWNYLIRTKKPIT